jgi:hypothetical protein
LSNQQKKKDRSAAHLTIVDDAGSPPELSELKYPTCKQIVRTQQKLKLLSIHPHHISEEAYMPIVNKCGNWSATLYSNTLKVHGECTVPTPGYKVHLTRKVPQGINPDILLLEKTVVAPKGIEPQHVATLPVSFEEHTTAHYHEVQILPDGTTIKVKHAAHA